MERKAGYFIAMKGYIIFRIEDHVIRNLENGLTKVETD